jgi:tRNA(fMet)-specific endonuclease VapC
VTRYLLDTNIVSDLIRNPIGRVAAGVAKVGESRVCTSVIVAAELRYGVAKKGSARLEARVSLVLNLLEILPFEPPADVAYGQIRAQLERAGEMIGRNDLYIAAHALTLGLALVTDNEREFSRVAGLKWENWLR